MSAGMMMMRQAHATKQYQLLAFNLLADERRRRQVSLPGASIVKRAGPSR
jgi:hypothetical protein